MNFSRNHFILLLLLGITCIVKFIIFNKNYQLKKVEEELNNHSDKIENCIDIENKSKRTYYENIKLSEYCIDKFGTKK